MMTVAEPDKVGKGGAIVYRFLTLMPCGLYIWLAARLSLYPPVWLITWRRVSTWNGEGGGHRDKEERPVRTMRAGGTRPVVHHGKVRVIVKGYRKQKAKNREEGYKRNGIGYYFNPESKHRKGQRGIRLRMITGFFFPA